MAKEIQRIHKRFASTRRREQRGTGRRKSGHGIFLVAADMTAGALTICLIALTKHNSTSGWRWDGGVVSSPDAMNVQIRTQPNLCQIRDFVTNFDGYAWQLLASGKPFVIEPAHVPYSDQPASAVEIHLGHYHSPSMVSNVSESPFLR